MADIQLVLEQMARQQIAVQQNVPLAPYTTFRIGGPAKLFCEPQNEIQLATALEICRVAGERTYLLGRGSNTVFCDEGFDGMVLHLADGLAELHAIPKNGEIIAEAGLSLMILCKKAAELGLTGLEFAYGIPGSVGGAVYMNAGAYGGEMAQVVTAVEYLDPTGKRCRAAGEALAFGYRTSCFEDMGGTILRVHFKLSTGCKADILARMEELRTRRIEKQPLDKPSAGSTFKRPQGAYAAALIEACGLKGFRIGGAEVSSKHSGFVVNVGGASCADVLAVADHVTEVVRQKTGYLLEKEIRVVR